MPAKKKTITIVAPAYNEEEIIEGSIKKLYNFFKKEFKNFSWKIIIAEHDSHDKTVEKAEKAIKKCRNVFLVSLSNVSKSEAVKNAWLKNKADIMIYTDIDLSAELYHLKEMVKYLDEGCDIVIGSRNLNRKNIGRNIKREILSAIYNLMIYALFGVRLTDFQCGFKAMSRKVVERMIPKMQFLEEGFMDTELLIIAAKKGYNIKEIAVKWKDTRSTRFSIARVTIKFFQNLFRLKIAMIKGDYKF